MKFIIDKEIDLNKQDFLNTSSYSKALREVIKFSPQDSSFTIGLFGEWGSGKSSIVKTVEEEFSKTKKVKFVIYDAWKYSNDSFRRMFLLKLQEELGFDRTEKFDSFYKNKTSDLSIKRKVEWKYILLTTAILLLGILFVNLLPKENIETKITISVLFSFLGILVNVLGRAFNDYKVTVQEPMIFAPEQFEECFNEMIPRVFEKGFAHNVSKWINGVNHISGLEKLVIVIDNIDRCPKDKAYEMITNIKSFLSTQKKVIFLIPVDDEALKRHIIKEENNDSKEAEEFLRKFFSVTIRIKPFKRFDLYDFTNKINKDFKLEFNPTTIDIVSKEYATNPRRIIQFFNDLMSELKIFELNQSVDFIKTNESLICKMLILRQEWPEFYKMISKNSNLIIDTDSVAKYLDNNEDLNSFLLVTESITKNESISVIETVLSTFDRASKLSTELISFVDKKAFQEIEKSILDKNVDIDDLIDFLIERLNTGIKRRTYQTDVNNTFELICLLDSMFKLKRTQNERISTEVRFHLKHFYTFLTNHDAVINYGHRLKTQGLPYLDLYLLQFLKANISFDVNENPYITAKTLFRKYIKNKESKAELVNLKSLFEIDYARSSNTLSEYNLESEQLDNIVNDNVIEAIIVNILSISNDDKGFQEIVYASKNINFSKKSFKSTIIKFNELIPSLANCNKEQIINYISTLNTFLAHQNNVVSNDENEKNVFQSFKNKFLSNRIIHGRHVNILSESLTNDEVSILSNFLKYIYICSSYNVDTLQELNLLISISPSERQEIVNKHLLELKNDYNFTLTPLSDFILNDNTIAFTSLELIKYILTYKVKGNYRLHATQVTSKLENLLNTFSSDIENHDLKHFFDEIINDERAKTILSSIITRMSKENILHLPKNIQVLSFDKILEGDTIHDYEDQLDFLKALAKEGEMRHINKLVKVVTTKMQREEKFSEGLDILSEIKKLRPSDKKLIEGIIESLEDESKKERAKAILNNLQQNDTI